MRKASALAALIAGLVVPATARGRVSPREIRDIWHALPRPRLAIAGTERAPAIDGEVGQDEWRAASVVTGFIGTDSPRWKGTPGYDLASAQTTARVTYDAAKLYIAFRCNEPEIETLKVQGEAGRDGPLWRDDCVELFLSPPEAEHYFHFIANSRGSIYDAKEAPGKKGGKAWNMEGIEVACSVSPPGDDSYWLVEMALPFEGLGAAPPAPGEVWRVNFARERYAADYRAIVEYSTWSGLAGGFQQPAFFGELCFCNMRQDIRLGRPSLGPNGISAELLALGDADRRVALSAATASVGGMKPVRSRDVTLRARRPTRSGFPVTIRSEGPQVFALTVSDADTGDLLSCSRIPFHVPEVTTAAKRVGARLGALVAKASEEAAFGRGVEALRVEIDAVLAEAEALLLEFGHASGDALRRLTKRWHELIEAGADQIIHEARLNPPP